MTDHYREHAFRIRCAGRLIHCAGTLDIMAAPEVKARLHERIGALGAYETLVVDLLNVDYIDAAGIGALLSAQKVAADAEVGLCLVIDSPRILKVFAVTGLEKVFAVYRTLAAAESGR